MEAQLLKHFVPSTCTILPMGLHLTNSISKALVRFTSFPRRANKQMGRFCIAPQSKRSAYQDFQDFVKPSRLLPATEPNTYTDYVADEILSSVSLDNSKSFYMVELRTSKDFGSCLRDLNAAILLGLISVSGDSIIQRIPAVSWQHHGHEKDGVLSETVHFQRGSVDVITFRGPKLGKIESVWIGLESGSWRLDGVGLTIINNPQPFPSSIKITEDENFEVMQYKFDAHNILLGEGGVSVAELRPVLVTESPMENLTLTKIRNPSPSVASKEQSNEESMREYSDLKFSLLLYDLILVFVGSPIVLTLTSEERYAYSFFFGGLGGFFYLLLLQKSVDGLSTVGEMESLVQGFGGMKGPLFSLALILAASIVAVRNGIGGSSLVLTPADLFVGAAGFLACKIAVVLAAFKPIKRSWGEKK